MTSPFDPRSWLPPGLPGIPGITPARPAGAGERSWLDTWMDMTTWWIAPVTAAAGAMRPEQLLAQLIDGIATRFAGQRIVVSIDGRAVPALLDSLRLLRRDDRFEVRVDVREVEVQGVRVDELSAVARSVSIDPGLETTIVARRIETSGTASLEDLVAWMDARTDEWTLRLDVHGRVRATHVARSVDVVVEPSVRDGVAYLEIREVGRKRWHVPVPAWLRLERTIDLTLADGWTLVEARRAGDRVHFRLRCDELSHGVNPAGLRDAILRGDTLEL
jgi:hypothetical protein